MKKTLHTNIAMNDPYDTRLCQTHAVQCYTDHSPQCSSEVFFSILPNCLFVIIISHAYFTRQCRDTFTVVVGYVISTLLQIVRRMCQEKNFENRSLIGEDMDKRKVQRFYGPPCISTMLCILYVQYLHSAKNGRFCKIIADDGY